MDYINLPLFLEDVDKLRTKVQNFLLDESNYIDMLEIEAIFNVIVQIAMKYSIKNKEEISDGYHTFEELYAHRTALLAAFMNQLCMKSPSSVFKSKFHADGTMYENYFIAGVLTEDGWATYHQSMDWWDNFNVPVKDKAPEWDGHTPDDALHRILSTFC